MAWAIRVESQKERRRSRSSPARAMRTPAIMALRQTPRLPAAMLATWVPWEEGTRCDCRSISVADSLSRDSAAIALFRWSCRNSAPKSKAGSKLWRSCWCGLGWAVPPGPDVTRTASGRRPGSRGGGSRTPGRR